MKSSQPSEASHDAPGRKRRKPRRKRRSFLRTLLALTLVLTLLGAAAAGVAFAVVSERFGGELPDIAWAEHYRPPIVSDVFSGDDQLLGELYNERRRVVPYARLPKKLVQAFVAAEDARFFDHGGVDTFGIARALVQNALSGRKKSGASTLTQQTAKAILISTWGYERATQKTYRRKVYEALLARRLEARFSKEEILGLYLNQVYLGHSSYGVQAAAENYFRKNVGDLSLGEMALLAGLPQAPSSYSPFRHPERAKARRQYVLRRMLEEGMISRADHDEAERDEVVVHPVEDVFRETAPFVTEHVRRDMVQRYGNDRLLNDGLKIYATVDLDLEREAIAASLSGLLAADKRQGYRGPLQQVKGAKQIAELRTLQRTKGAAPDSAAELDPDQVYVGVVTAVSKDSAKVGIGDRIDAVLPLGLMTWARKPNTEQNYGYTAPLDAATKALSAGDVILVRVATAAERRDLAKGKKPAGDEPLYVALEQEPSLQGALVSMDPKSGYIVAMIGGYDFNKSEFNRAFQACRQPGSAFKPIVYSAAIEKLGWTASTQILDAPIVFDDTDNEKRWKPSNFELDFKGDVPLRLALVNSMNIPAVRTLEAVGARDAAAWARHLGITTQVNEDLSIALGSSCVTLWDLTHVYAMLNQGGRKVRSTFVRRVVDRDGRVLEDHSSYYDPWTSLENRISAGYAELFQEREQLMEPQTAFLTTNLLKEVARYGTAARARALGRTVAGKTGTTNDAFDAWFMGFSADLVTGVWVGYDTYESPMGKYETGGRTALPIWMDFMAGALKGRPDKNFPEPPGIVWVPIDAATGRAVPRGAPNAFLEAYKEGTEPTLEDNAPAVEDLYRNQDL